ncbi:MAG: hypothetical protein ACRD2X_07645, partial [Vicinamibacteraceae bacterium]
HSETYARLGSPPVEPRLLLWAKRLAREPERASAADIDELRSLGLDDRAILDAIQTVSYFAYVNRLVLAAGVGVEEDFQTTCRAELEE